MYPTEGQKNGWEMETHHSFQCLFIDWPPNSEWVPLFTNCTSCSTEWALSRQDKYKVAIQKDTFLRVLTVLNNLH